MKRTVIDLDITVATWHEEGADLSAIADVVQKAVAEKLGGAAGCGRAGPVLESRFVDAYASLPSDDSVIEADVPDGFAKRVRASKDIGLSQKRIAKRLAGTPLPFSVDLRQAPRVTNYDWVDYDVYFVDATDTSHIVQFGISLAEGLDELAVELQQVRREKTSTKWTNSLGLDALSEADRMYAESMMRRTARHLDQNHPDLSITFNP